MLPDARADDASVAVLEVPSTSHRFGDRGDVIVDAFAAGNRLDGATNVSLFGLDFAHDSQTTQGFLSTTTHTGLSPSLDFFAGRHFSIGATLTATYDRISFSSPANGQVPASDASAKTLTAGFAPRFGWVVSLSDHVALWPRVSVGMFAYDVVDKEGGDSLQIPLANPFDLEASADLQIVYSVDRRLFVAVAPSAGVGGAPENGAYPSTFHAWLGSSFRAGFVL